jgi:hypothetical protein
VIIGSVPVRHDFRARAGVLREPEYVCYSLGMDADEFVAHDQPTTVISAQAVLEVAQNAVDGLLTAFTEAHESGDIDSGEDAARWLKTYHSGVMSVRF